MKTQLAWVCGGEGWHLSKTVALETWRRMSCRNISSLLQLELLRTGKEYARLPSLLFPRCRHSTEGRETSHSLFWGAETGNLSSEELLRKWEPAGEEKSYRAPECRVPTVSHLCPGCLEKKCSAMGNSEGSIPSRGWAQLWRGSSTEFERSWKFLCFVTLILQVRPTLNPPGKVKWYIEDFWRKGGLLG